ncbi:MAG: energy transducer TonB [Maricaulaceae bacterium]
MYQTVDEPEEIRVPDQGDDILKRIWRSFGLLALILIAITAVIAVMQSRQAPAAGFITETERGTYRKALGETNPALRRARLHDYIASYPKSNLRFAAAAQLDVLNTYETQSWAGLTEDIYDETLSRADKLSAIETYETLWGSAYVGGRETELGAIKTYLGPNTSSNPDRALEETDSPIPDDIDDTEMAGGPVVKDNEGDASGDDTETADETNTSSAGKRPKVVRNVSPRYPKRALRRNIEAVVDLNLTLDAKGRVEAAELVSVDAEKYAKDFVKAAKFAALRTRYEPHMVDGEAVPLEGITKRYTFKIDDD